MNRQPEEKQNKKNKIAVINHLQSTPAPTTYDFAQHNFLTSFKTLLFLSFSLTFTVLVVCYYHRYYIQTCYYFIVSLNSCLCVMVVFISISTFIFMNIRQGKTLIRFPTSCSSPFFL